MRAAVLVLFCGLAVALAADTATPMADTGTGVKPGTTTCEDPTKIYNEIFKKCLPKQGTDGFTGHPTGTAALTDQHMAAGGQLGGGHQLGGQQTAGGQPIAGQQIGAGLSEDDLKKSRAPIIIMPGAVRAFVPMTIFGKDVPKNIAEHLEKEPKELKEGGGTGADATRDDDDRRLRAEPFRGGGGFGGRFGGPGFGWGGGRFGGRFGGPFGYGRFGFGGPFGGYGYGGPFGGYGYGYDPYAYAPPTIIPVPVDGSDGGGDFAGGGPRGNMTVGRLQGAGAASGDRQTGPILIMPGAVRLDMPIVVYGADLDDKAAASTKPEERPAEPRAPVSSGGGDVPKETVKEPAKAPVKEPAKAPIKEPAKEPATQPAKEPLKPSTATEEPPIGRRSGLSSGNVWRNPLFADKLTAQSTGSTDELKR